MLNASTKPDSIVRLEQLRAGIEFKAKLLSLARAFFSEASFVETETPVLIEAPAPEEYIEAVSASDSAFLRTSPELQMKRLLAAGFQRIFQIGPCFRQGEYGRIHRPEFTMLEWYMADSDYTDIMIFTIRMIKSAASKLLKNNKTVFRDKEIDFSGNWHSITVSDAFQNAAGMSPEDAIKKNIFEETLVEKVEPSLPSDKPCFLVDYPASLGALARLKPGVPEVAERWELYIGGVEIANAYSELTDPPEQRERFAEAYAFRAQNGMKIYQQPQEFYEALDYGIPPAAGCALGFDRLAMVMFGANDLSEIVFS
jgi:lysyl-tRNA synthetase class 2